MSMTSVQPQHFVHTSSAAEFDLAPATVQRRIEETLHQRVHWHELERTLTLCNGHYLLIEEWSHDHDVGNDVAEQLVNLACLDAEPEFIAGDIVRRVQVGVAASVLVAVFSLLFLPALTLMLLWLPLALTALAVMAARPGRWLFRSALARAPVVEVLSPLGAAAAARDFVALLSERIQGAEVVLPRGSQRLAAELAELRRLLRCRLLSKHEFELARQRLQEHLRRGATLAARG